MSRARLGVIPCLAALCACGGETKRPTPTPSASTSTTGISGASTAVTVPASASTTALTPKVAACITSKDAGAVSWSADAARFAAAHGSWVRIYASSDLSSWKELRTLIAGPARLTKIALSPDGKSLATGSAEGAVEIWDIESGKSTTRIDAYKSEIRILRFRPDGQLLFAADASMAALWKRDGALSGKLDLPEVEGTTARASAAAFSDDGTQLVVATPIDLRIVDGATAKPKTSLEEKGASFVAFTPGGAYVVVAGTPRWLRLWELKTRKMAHSYLELDKFFGAAGISHASIDGKQGWLAFLEVGGDPVARPRLRVYGVLPLGLVPAAAIASPEVPRRMVVSPRDGLALGVEGSEVHVLRVEGSKLRSLQTIARGTDPCPPQ